MVPLSPISEGVFDSLVIALAPSYLRYYRSRFYARPGMGSTIQLVSAAVSPRARFALADPIYESSDSVLLRYPDYRHLLNVEQMFRPL